VKRRAVVTLVLATGGITPPVAAAAPPGAPTTRVRNCTTAGCHAQILDHEVLHAPAAISSCDSCHTYTDPAEHAFTLKREGAELCTFCHLGAGTQRALVGHRPFDEGNCTGCHDPHGSHDSNFLKADTQAGLCMLCHADVRTGTHVHTPAADGECLGCHSAHDADHKGLLTRDGSAMCYTCHEDTHDLVTNAVMVHKPAGEDCLACHQAHASDHANHLSAEPLELCTNCHPGPAMTARHAPVTHSAVLEGRACLNCHQPHASNHEGMLHLDPVASCLACHDGPITREDGRIVHGVPEIARDGAELHGPVRKQLCTGCHELHGSEHADLLAANYSSNFYEPFRLENYALCFECHAKELVLARESTIETNFRNGSENLHFVHVNRDRNGRSCRSCHATHASMNRLHVPQSVPYGSWELPLNFTMTKTGGRCDSACHRPATYDRVQPTIGIEDPTGGDAE
jgi:predicted CXXCH cytochrome family protein